MSSNNNRRTVSHKLGDVVRRELGVQLDKEHQASGWGGALSPDMLLYAAEDSRPLHPPHDGDDDKLRVFSKGVGHPLGNWKVVRWARNLGSAGTTRCDADPRSRPPYTSAPLPKYAYIEAER